MMLIHDIDASIAIVEYMAEGEEKQKAAIQYVIDHFNQIDSLPVDTLYTAVSMLGTIFTDGKYFDDSKEKVFNSSQDSWKNLDDMPFVDNMERFYKSRHYLETMMTQSPQWKFPMSQDEYYDLMSQDDYYDLMVQIDDNAPSPQKSCAAILKEKLRDSKIRYYIDYSSSRARILRENADSWKRLSDRNKFIMNISDEELAEYAKKSQRSGRTVSKSDIIGQWEFESSAKNMWYYDFTKSGSFSIKTVTHFAHPFYSGDIIVTLILGGKWDINGDTLTLNYSPEIVKAKIDRSGISYRAEMRDSVETFIDNHFQEEALMEDARKRSESVKKTTFVISVNKSGDKLELALGRSEDSENVSYYYLIRSNSQRQ